MAVGACSRPTSLFKIMKMLQPFNIIKVEDAVPIYKNKNKKKDATTLF